MSLVEAFVRNPVKVTVGVLLVSLFGIIGLLAMPMQLTPEVQIPTLTIETRWPGASPQEVEQEIIQEQEEQLKSVEGVTKLSSESKDSSGSITLEFAIGTNMEEALLKVNSRLQQVPVYPENADQPVITTSNSSNSPIAWFILSPRIPSDAEFQKFEEAHPELREALVRIRKCHNVGLGMLRLRELVEKHPEAADLLPTDVDVTKLRRFAEDYIESTFERVPGVANSNVIGGLEDELQVVVDPELLAARELTIYDVRNVLRNQNADTSGGDFWEGKRRWVVRTLGQFRSKEQVESQLLAVREGRPVFVRDVATVQEGFKKPDGLVRRFGGSGIAINCLREDGANVLDVMEGLRAANDRLNSGILEGRDLQLTQVYDETEYIYSAIGLVNENIYMGSALTMVILMLCLHLNRWSILLTPLILGTGVAAVYLSEWYFVPCLVLILWSGLSYARGALVIGLSIPISVVATFLALSLLGRTLNVISLAGLAFAVGIVVDNATVVLENIYTRYQMGESPFTAAVKGTQEVWGAVVASTLTNVSVFLPVVFVQEEAGQLFRDIALAISISVGFSMLVAVIVIPPAAARILPRRRQNAADVARNAGAIARWLDHVGEGTCRGVDVINRWIQRTVIGRLATVTFFMAVGVVCTYLLWPAVEYLPNGNRNLVFGILLPPPGYNLDELTDMGEFVEAELRPYWDINQDDPDIVSGQKPAIGDFFFVARGRQVFLGVRALDPQRAGELIPLVRGVSAKLPGTFAVAFQSSLFSQGLVAGRTIDIEITGPDLQKLVQLGGRILGGEPPGTPDRVASIFELIPDCQARPVPSLDLSSPEVHVTPRLLQSAEMGMSAVELGYTVDALVDGAYASDYFLGADKIDLSVRGRDEFAQKTQDLDQLPIATRTGQLVPLAALADITLSSGPEQVNHRERERAITIAVTPPQSMPLETALALIQSEVIDRLERRQDLDGGYRITLAGTADKLRETWNSLRMNVVLALLITYLLMAALYESWVYPLVIILTVPLGAVGGVLGLQLLNWYLALWGQPPQTLDVLTMLGFVILIGTVVNNPILIIDYALQMIRNGTMKPAAAVVDAAQSRVRPIFITSMTTVLGLLPLVLIPGAGSELYRGLGSVVLGGITVSTVFTLFLIPAAFTLTLDFEHWIYRRLGWKQEATAIDDESPSDPEPPAPTLRELTTV